jgi:Ca2+-binding RTX toxin-like protein
MRRTSVLLAAMAMMVLLAASVALAATVTCPFSGSCYGTKYADTLNGGGGSNSIYGYNGNDIIRGFSFHDDLYGSYGDDRMYGDHGDDRMYGGPGYDTMYGGAHNDVYDGGQNSDRMVDGDKYSHDTYFGFVLPLLIESSAGYGNDTVSDYGGSSDILDLSTRSYLARSDVLISWHDTSDADTNLDALRIERKGTTSSVLIYNYFDNQGGTGRGSGAIERITFEGGNYVGFPASEG